MIEPNQPSSLTTRILIYRNGAIGDTILTAPVVAALYMAFPNSRITLLGHRERCRLLVREGLAHEAISAEDLPLHQLYAGGDAKTVFGHLANDLEILLWYGSDPERKIQSALAGIASQVCIHSPEPDTQQTEHVVDHLLNPLERMGVAIFERTVRIPVSEQERERRRVILQSLEAKDGPIVLLAPGASHKNKRWPLERFAKLAKDLDRNFSTPPKWIVLTGPDEWELSQHLCRLLSNLNGSHTRRVHPLPELNLADLAAVISCGTLYIGNDSGATHLAAGLGIPTVSIFLQTDPHIWSPRGAYSGWEWGNGDDGHEAIVAKCQFVLDACYETARG